jgi:hypothetical protein
MAAMIVKSAISSQLNPAVVHGWGLVVREEGLDTNQAYNIVVGVGEIESPEAMKQ